MGVWGKIMIAWPGEVSRRMLAVSRLKTSRVAGLALKDLLPHRRCFAFALVVSGLFFADPALIGPQLYPSSSVMRFFWCYVLIFLLSRLQLRGLGWLSRYRLFGSLSWVCGLFWSAESAIYASAIFFSSLLLLAWFSSEADVPLKKRAGPVLAALSLPLGLAVLAALGTGLGYWVYLRHLPDWRMFAEYILGYGGGFGEVSLTPAGPIWIFLLALLGLLAAVRFRRGFPPEARVAAAGLASLATGLWILSSYFIGRAVPNNVTALLPLIALALVLGCKLAEGTQPFSALALKFVSVPILTVLFASNFASPAFLPALLHFRSFRRDVAEELRPFDRELAELKQKAGVTPRSRVAYYGFAAAMPREELPAPIVSYEKNWLPTPLQLLEEPIAPGRRQLILSRYMERNARTGFFIQARGEREDRAAEWLRLISLTHEQGSVWESPRYRIIYFQPRPRPAPAKPD